MIIPEKGETHIYLPDHPVRVHSFEELLDGRQVLPGFSVRLSDILEY